MHIALFPAQMYGLFGRFAPNVFLALYTRVETIFLAPAAGP